MVALNSIPAKTNNGRFLLRVKNRTYVLTATSV